MKSNIEQLKLAEKDLGESCRKCCSMANNCCCYFVSKAFKQAGNGSLFYNGVTVTYCPNAIKWCKTHMAQIPMYLAMPDDVIFFDWNKNKSPDHIALVRQHKSCNAIYTLEGNTTQQGIVAYQTRPAKYVLAIYRPHFKGKYDISKPIEVDGVYGYSSIALTQKWLKIEVDGILGLGTVKALQKKLKVEADGIWGKGTSKALQKLIGAEADGEFGEDSVKALQRYLNKQVFKTTTTATTKPVAKPQTPVTPSAPKPTPKPVAKPKPVEKPKEKSWQDKACDWVKEIADDNLFHYVRWKSNDPQTHKCPICSGIYDIYENLKKGTYKVGSEGTEVKWIQKFLKWNGSKLTVDGKYGNGTASAVKAFQRKNKLKVDGIWGDETRRKAKAILKKYLGGNCIWLAYAALHHGGGLPTNCSCGVVANEQYNKLLKVSQKQANKLASKWLGGKAEVIRNGGKPIPISILKKADVLVLYHGDKYYHTAFGMGGDKYAESNTTGGIGDARNIRANLTMSSTFKANLKVAIRYIGD